MTYDPLRGTASSLLFPLITVAEADQLLSAHAQAYPPVQVPLAGAGGRVLRESVVADRDQPPFDRVAMDGVALAWEAVEAGARRLRIASTQRAGESPHARPEPGSCVEVMTGAAIPHGCDTVVPYEHLRIEDGVAEMLAEVRPGQNVHARATDCRAGETVLEGGERLTAPHIAALASVGKASVRVAAQPRIAVLTTGDELVGVEAPALPHQIRQSNGWALRAGLVGGGYPDVTLNHAADDAPALRRALGAALERADVLVVTGGVSAGRFDLVPETLGALGVREVFHRIRQKPGKPLWFGTSAEDRAVFGLPGNPVSALVGLYRYVLPFLDRSVGAGPIRPPWVILTDLPVRKNDFTHFVPVRREGLDARPVRSNGSGDALALLASDGFVEVAPGMSAPGPTRFYPWG